MHGAGMKPKIKWGRLILLVIFGPIGWALYLIVWFLASVATILPF